MAKCFLCGREDKDTIIKRDGIHPIFGVSCGMCGEYRITDLFLKVGNINSERKKAIIWFIKGRPNYLINTDSIDIIEQEYRIYISSLDFPPEDGAVK